MALILFLQITGLSASLPLTQTIYTLPESKIELNCREEFLRSDSNYRKEQYKLGIGLKPKVSVWYSFDYLHNGAFKTHDNEMGDSFLKLWLYPGNFFNNTINAGLLIESRIPTGTDSYADQRWKYLSFGNNELKIGPVIQAEPADKIYLHLNIFHVFREASGENLYSGMYLSPLRKETYIKVLGFNYRSDKTFFNSERLENDYVVLSCALNTEYPYPLIPFLEIYCSIPYNIDITNESAERYLAGLGARYFFTREIYLSFYYIYNLKAEKNNIKDISGFDFSLQF